MIRILAYTNINSLSNNKMREILEILAQVSLKLCPPEVIRPDLAENALKLAANY